MLSVAWYSLLFLTYSIGEAAGQRNAAAEQLCQAFLISPSTSPLLPTAQRNLTADEDAEFECELVLQDRHLPAQIRLTVRVWLDSLSAAVVTCLPAQVHEGLFLLSVRHVAMGYDKHRDAIRHARILREMLPRSRKFALYAARWAAAPAVGAPEEALRSLQCAFGGDCTEYDSVAPAEERAARRLYARLLSHFGRDREALAVLLAARSPGEPPDFGLSFALADTTTRLPGDLSDGAGEEKATAVLRAEVARLAVDNYEGFRVPPAEVGWRLREEDLCGPQGAGVDEGVFLDHLRRREPLMVRSCGLDASLQWGTDRWTRERLAAAAGNVNVEVERVRAAHVVKLGYGTAGLRRVESFAQFLSAGADGCGAAAGQRRCEHVQFLAGQPVPLSLPAAPYSEVLSRLQDDIPTPPFLNRSSETRVTAVDLWMGGGAVAPHTRSRLRADLLDRLVVLVRGESTVHLFSPDSAAKMSTLFPTFAVAPNGHSFQYVPANGKHHPDDITNRHFSTTTADELKVSCDHALSVLLYLPSDIELYIGFCAQRVCAPAGGRHAVSARGLVSRGALGCADRRTPWGSRHAHCGRLQLEVAGLGEHRPL